MISGSCRFVDRLQTEGNPAVVHVQPDVQNAEAELRDDRAIETIRGVPYQHQVHCTPAGFSGHWACNGTAAVMAIAYYGLLSDWDFVASTPFNHTSHLGRYVSDIYTLRWYDIQHREPGSERQPRIWSLRVYRSE